MKKLKDFFDSGYSVKVLFSAILTSIAVGTIYIWSVFIIPLEKQFGWTRSDLSFVFALTIIFYSLGVVFCGYLLSRFKIRKVMILGATLLPSAYFAASFSDNIYFMYLTYGIMGGTAMGIIFNIALYNCGLCFTKKFGFVSGFLQTCVCLSSLFLGMSVASLINAYGWQTALRIVAAFNTVAMLLSVIFLQEPRLAPVANAADDYRESGDEVNIKWREMVRTPAFLYSWLMRVAVLSGGLGVVGNAVPLAIELGQSPAAAVFAMGVLSFCNAMGCVILGLVWDKAGSKRTMFLNNALFISAFSLLILATFLPWSALVLLAFALTGFSYGGVNLIGAAFTRTFFGSKYFATNYGFVIMAMLAASFIGPYITNFIKANSGSYYGASYVFLCFGFFAVLCAFCIKSPQKL